MKLTTKIAIAQLLTAAGSVLTAFATEMSSETPASPEAAAQPEAPKPRGRKAAAAAPAEPQTGAQEPAETAEEPAATTPANGAKVKTYEDMKALIEGPVKEGRGEEVKKEIAKFSATGLKNMDPKHYAEFEKNIIALSY